MSSNTGHYNIKKTVAFDLTPTVIEEPSDISDLLQEYRISDYTSIKILLRKLERLQQEILLNPILSSEHRETIVQRNLNCLQSEK